MSELDGKGFERLAAVETTLAYVLDTLKEVKTTMNANYASLATQVSEAARLDRRETLEIVKENTNNLIGLMQEQFKQRDDRQAERERKREEKEKQDALDRKEKEQQYELAAKRVQFAVWFIGAIVLIFMLWTKAAEVLKLLK